MAVCARACVCGVRWGGGGRARLPRLAPNGKGRGSTPWGPLPVVLCVGAAPRAYRAPPSLPKAFAGRLRSGQEGHYPVFSSSVFRSRDSLNLLPTPSSLRLRPILHLENGYVEMSTAGARKRCPPTESEVVDTDAAPMAPLNTCGGALERGEGRAGRGRRGTAAVSPPFQGGRARRWAV